MKYLASIILLIVFFSTLCSAQYYTPPKDIIEKAPEWAQLMYSDNPNAFEVERAFRAYYQDKIIPKNMHTRNYKFFRRSIRFRTQSDGSIAKKSNPSYQATLQKNLNRTNNRNNSSGNWSFIGPIQSTSQQGNPSENQACVYSIDQSLTNSNIVYCGTEPGEVYKSIDSGNNWINVSLNLVLPFENSAVTSIAIHPSNPNTVYFGVQDMIYQTTDGGTTWSLLSSLNSGNGAIIEKILIHPTQTNTILVACTEGLFRSTNGGTSWTTIFTDRTLDVEVNTASDNIIYTLRKNDPQSLPEFLTSTDFGQTFTIQTNGWYNSIDPNRDFETGRIAVSADDPNRVYALLFGQSKDGDYGYIGLYRSNNGGSTWTLPNGPIGAPYNPTTHPNIASADGEGQSPDNILADASFCALAVDPNDADRLLLGGLNLWKSDDGGATFQILGGYLNGPFNDEVNTNGFHVDQQEYKTFGNTTWLTTDGGIYKSTDFFSTTNFEKKNSGIHSTDFWGFGSGWNQDILVAGVYHNGVMAYNETYGAGIYLDLENGAGEPSSGYVNPGQNNLVYSTDIGGIIIPDVIGPTTFFSEQFIPNESYNPIEEGYSDFVFHPNCYSIAYAGKEHELWKTTDKGQTFQKIKTFGTTVDDFITYIHISRVDPNIMYLCQRLEASNTAKLWKSLDAGITWTEIVLPANIFKFTILQVDPYNPSIIYLASSTLGNPSLIYKSQNSGATWTNITSPTIADEFAMSLDYIPGTNGGIYLGTNLGMYYKNDNMPNWMDFSNGLPAVSTTRKSRPFYRDNKLRIASTKGMWESELHERPDQPFAQIMVNDLDTCMVTGTAYRFVDYSILKHQGATWEWTFEGGTPTTASNWFADVTYTTPGTYRTILKITDDRGLTDSDTLEVNIRASSLNLNINFDQFGDETTWDIQDSNGTLIASGGPYEEGTSNYTETITCPGSGCFTFNIYDSLDNGICCEEGNGSYTLTDGSGMLLASGGDFGDQMTHSFCLCKESDFITGTIPTNTFEVNNLLESDGTINSPEMVNFNAGFEIDLKPLFEVAPGAMFLAQITPCLSTVNFDNDDNNVATKVDDSSDAFDVKLHDSNPTFSLFELNIPKVEKIHFEVWGASNQSMLSTNIYEFNKAGQHHLKFDHNNLPTGDYLVKVFTDSYEQVLRFTKE